MAKYKLNVAFPKRSISTTKKIAVRITGNPFKDPNDDGCYSTPPGIVTDLI